MQNVVKCYKRRLQWHWSLNYRYIMIHVFHISFNLNHFSVIWGINTMLPKARLAKSQLLQMAALCKHPCSVWEAYLKSWSERQLLSRTVHAHSNIGDISMQEQWNSTATLPWCGYHAMALVSWATRQGETLESTAHYPPYRLTGASTNTQLMAEARPSCLQNFYRHWRP